MKHSVARRWCALLALAAAPLVPASALAQGLPLDRFNPAPVGDRMFGVPSPFVAGHLTAHAGLILDYAHNPLILRETKDDKGVGSVVSSQLFLHVNGTFALWNRLALNIDVPVALAQSGDSPKVDGTTIASPGKAQFGDLRFGARVRAFGEYEDPFQLGLQGYVWAPTGPSGAYVGTGKARGLVQVLLGGRTDRLVWSFAAGPEISGTTVFAGVSEGTSIDVGAGLGVLLLDNRHLQIGPEIYGAFTVANGDKSINDSLKHASNIEILVDARYRIIDDLEVGVGLGPGVTSGLGTPDFRGVLMAAYTPEMKRKAAVTDRDGDGIPDDVDACPDVKGVPSEDPKKNGCPPDRDGDGIPDDVDACPDQPGPANADPTKNGCPLPQDTDGDGILDPDDACPTVPGVRTNDKTTNGCPPDRDGDGIPDDVDACPDERGVKSSDPKFNGCPPDLDGDGIPNEVDACPREKGPADKNPKRNGCPRVHVTDSEIVILEQVQFDTGLATIKKASDGLLDNVASVFKDHPEILKVEVQGHTDNKGTAALNKGLSQRRADAVSKALQKRGIAKERLFSKGYGQDVPIADNSTEDGRAENRRVQFKILDRKREAAK